METVAKEKADGKTVNLVGVGGYDVVPSGESCVIGGLPSRIAAIRHLDAPFVDRIETLR